jgi:heme/copper-type cytochrome/quinol oxidase subunit 2
MPIVVDVRSAEDYSKWVVEQKAAMHEQEQKRLAAQGG